jgi:hypothetical protein
MMLFEMIKEIKMLVCTRVVPNMILLQVAYLRIVSHQRVVMMSIEGRILQEKTYVLGRLGRL